MASALTWPAPPVSMWPAKHMLCGVHVQATCTSPPVPGRPGKIALDYTVAYILDQQSLASRRAVAELLDKLTGEVSDIQMGCAYCCICQTACVLKGLLCTLH